jgi:CheY-like chemotaxis protein
VSCQPSHERRSPLVLIVEDEIGTQNALASLLRMDGWSVACAFDGEEALTLMADRAPELVVTDYMMPRLDGLAMLDRMKADSALAGIPVVLMSAAALGRERYQAAAAFLPKPIDLDELRRVLVTTVGFDPAAD